MPVKIALLGACLLVTRVFSQDNEFEKKINLITKMNDLYEKVLETDVYDDALRSNLEQQIESNCGKETEGSGQWILNLMTVDSQNNILRRSYIKSYLNITKTKEFLNQTTHDLMNAIKMDFWCQAKMGNRTAATSLIGFQTLSKAKLDELATTIDRLMLGWEENLKRDIAHVLESGSHKISLTHQIKNLLIANYSYGEWLIVITEGDVHRAECFKEGIFHYRSPNVKSHSALVVLAPPNPENNFQKANRCLHKIGLTKSVDGPCDSLATSIMMECGFQCGSGDFTFFGVYQSEIGLSPTVANTATKYYHLVSGTTVRTSGQKTCGYHIAIFA